MKNIIIFNEEALINFLKLGAGYGSGDIGGSYGGGYAAYFVNLIFYREYSCTFCPEGYLKFIRVYGQWS